MSDASASRRIEEPAALPEEMSALLHDLASGLDDLRAIRARIDDAESDERHAA
jgi:hypothetical protein